MSMLSEQVKKLRIAGEVCKMYKKPYVGGLLNQAADTIETLSAKLGTVNIERSEIYYGGLWIPCSERLPEKSGYYDVTMESKVNDEVLRTTECRCFHKDIKLWEEMTEPEFAIDETVIAWKDRPEPYYG